MSPQSSARRPRLPIGIAVVSVIAMCGSGAGLSRAAHPGDRGGLTFPVTDVIEIRDGARGDYGLPLTGAVDVAWDPSGHWLAFTVPGGSEPGLWVTDAAGCQTQRLTTDETDRAPAFTGSHLVYTRGDGSGAFAYDMEADAWTATPATAPFPDATDIAMSVMEGYYAYVLPPGGDHPASYVLMVDKLFEGTSVEVLRSPRPIRGTEWAPDGSVLLFERVSDAGSIELWRTDATGPNPTVERVLVRNGDVTDPSFSPDGSSLAYLNRLPGATGANVHVVSGGSTAQVASGATGGLDWQPVHPAWSMPARPIATAVEVDVDDPVTPGWTSLVVAVDPAPPAGSVRISVDGVPQAEAPLEDGRNENTVWLAEGTRTVRVDFLGDCPYRPSSTEVIVEVTAPPPPSPPFEDIGGSPFADQITWAWEHGITRGCAPDRFCPGDPVTRGEMATFLVRTLQLGPSERDWFGDDDGHPHEDAINRVATAAITLGCGRDRYCPDASVRRDQMASFLARAADLPPATTDAFSDDQGNAHEADINRIAQAGITNGCGASRYCPSALVTREQMVAFLYRAFADLWQSDTGAAG